MNVADSSQAQEYPKHPEGLYSFVVKLVKEMTSKKGNPMFVFELVPADDQPNRCRIGIFVVNTPDSFMLKRMCKACGLPEGGGFDSEEFVGKVFQGEVIQVPSKTEPDKTYHDFLRGSLKHLDQEPPPNTDSDLPF